MPPVRRFSSRIVKALHAGNTLGIRAGTAAHRFIGIWVVVVEGRVFVRSWDRKRGGWYRTFCEEPRGAIRIGDRELAVRALPTRSERLKDAIDVAYAEKYRSPGSRIYVLGFKHAKRRAATLELVPLTSGSTRTKPRA